jgi:hypothetical protein
MLDERMQTIIHLEHHVE